MIGVLHRKVCGLEESGASWLLSVSLPDIAVQDAKLALASSKAIAEFVTR